MIVGYANDPKYVNVVGVVSKQCNYKKTKLMVMAPI